MTHPRIVDGQTNAGRARRFLACIDPPPVGIQVINVMGEAGEMGEAYRRLTGYARRPGSREEFEAELADVIISAYVLAVMTETDLDAAVERKWNVIMARGFGNQAKTLRIDPPDCACTGCAVGDSRPAVDLAEYETARRMETQ